MVSNRSVLARLLAVLLAFGLIAAACGGDDDDSSTEEDQTETDSGTGGDEGAEEADDESEGSEEEAGSEESAEDSGAIVTEAEDDSDITPVSGGTLRMGLEAEVDGINPTTSSLSSPGLMMGDAVFDTLAAYNEENVAVPFLAESFTPNEDFTSWTVKLREGITFHDGTPLDSEALRANFETVIADPLVGLAVAPFYPSVEEGAFEIVDDLSATYNLLEPDAYWPAAVTGQLGMVASPTWLAAALEDPTLNQEPIGTGPFVFESRDADSVTRFVRNDNWWNGEVYLDAVEFVPVTDGDVAAALLLEGELNGSTTSQVAAIDTMASDPSIQNILDDTGNVTFAQMNTSAAPFDDIRVRQALTHATPRDNYVTLINLGVNRPAEQLFTPESPYYNPDVVQLSDMPELAGPLIDEYCAEFAENCSDGKVNIELQYSGPSVTQTRIAELLNEGWQEFFNVEFQELAQDQHINETAFGLFNVVTWRQFGAPEFSKDEVWISCKTIGGISLNWVKFCDEERDALWQQAKESLDPAERAELYQQWMADLNEDYLYIFFSHTLWDVALAPEVRNLCGRTSPEGEPLKCVQNGRAWFGQAFLSE